MTTPTREQIANDFSLWAEYVDPYGTMTEEGFDAMTIEEKVALQDNLWPDEEPEADDDAFWRGA